MMFEELRKIQEQVLFDAVRAESGEEVASGIVYGEHGEAALQDNGAWVKGAMKRLEERFNKPTVKQLRMRCQCGYGMDEKLALLRELMEYSHSLEEFAGQKKAQEAGLFCQDGELYLQFLFCPCPMLAQVDRLETNAWCQCTTGYSQVLFEKAFGCPVDVELLQSIKTGDSRCLMKILPRGTLWY